MKKKVTPFPSKFIDDAGTIFEVCNENFKYDYMLLAKNEHEIDYCTVAQMLEWNVQVIHILEK